jgi:hypothetical protein
VRRGGEKPDRCGNTRDRIHEIGKRSTHVRGCPSAMEGTSGRRERLIFTEGRRKRPWHPGGRPCVRARGRSSEATGVSEVRLDQERAEEETPRANQRKPTEANRAS